VTREGTKSNRKAKLGVMTAAKADRVGPQEGKKEWKNSLIKVRGTGDDGGEAAQGNL